MDYSPLDKITLNSANKKTTQSLPVFQTANSASAHATLDTEQPIFCIRASLVNTFVSYQGSDGGVITASELHKLLAKIHNILGSAMSKQVDNTVHI